MKIKRLEFVGHGADTGSVVAHSHLGFKYLITDGVRVRLTIMKGSWSKGMNAGSYEAAVDLANAHNEEMVSELIEKPVKRPHRKRKPRNRQTIGLTERLSRIVPGHEEMIHTNRDGYKTLMRDIHSNSKRASLPKYETRVLKAITAKDDVVYVVGVRIRED